MGLASCKVFLEPFIGYRELLDGSCIGNFGLHLSFRKNTIIFNWLAF